MASPTDRYYTPEHEWLRLEDDEEAVMGITEFAQDELGDIVYVELPEPGVEIVKGEPLGVVESVKAVSDLYAPVSGTVRARNTRLEDEPELVNQSPFDEGWMLRIWVAAARELDDLLDAAAYDRATAEQAE